MITINLADIQIVFTLEDRLPDDNPDSFVTEINGTISILRSNLIGYKKVGVLQALYLDLDEAKKTGVSIFDVLETHSVNTDECQLLFLRIGKLKSVIPIKFNSSNFLFLDRLELNPEYRSKGIGNFVTKRIIKHFGLNVPAIIKPSPLQNEGIKTEGFKPSKHYKEMGYDKLDKSGKSLLKLITVYESWGFKSIKKTPFMVYAPANSIRTNASKT